MTAGVDEEFWEPFPASLVVVNNQDEGGFITLSIL